MEQRWSVLIALCIREGGKTLMDAVNEVREAVDFCRYYAAQVEQDFVNPQVLPGITGEQNHLLWRGRGIFVCISPWNFPLAIFLGQVVAALAAGNPVVAKPAEATPLIAAAAVDILYEAGIPVEVLHFLPGRSRDMAAALLTEPRVMGVAFTGSTATAQFINRTLAARDAPIASFIAETGGLNAMVVDSSSLPEQVVDDIVKSAFLTAGQRCSALRLLFLQNDIAEKIIEMLIGATQELTLGNPMNLDTDIGPVISAQASQDLESHCEIMGKVASLVYQGQNPHAQGWFIAPRIYELPEAAVLKNEAFGPILHVVRYRASELNQVIAAINASGYGLTLGIHSRIGSVGEHIASHARVGNVYINRNMVGAVVGTQPFGGQGLSGTGFKAGGPNYLKRFATEQVITRNLTASGGNITLLGLADAD
jgi:RHH-type proline utilization regulon transcriptional repressor/proline dehydrogenase/delta 1-pyrroline-5-carboxylate dehydrogenase